MLKNEGFVSIALFAFIIIVAAVGGSFGLYYFNNVNSIENLFESYMPKNSLESSTTLEESSKIDEIDKSLTTPIIPTSTITQNLPNDFSELKKRCESIAYDKVKLHFEAKIKALLESIYVKGSYMEDNKKCLGEYYFVASSNFNVSGSGVFDVDEGKELLSSSSGVINLIRDYSDNSEINYSEYSIRKSKLLGKNFADCGEENTSASTSTSSKYTCFEKQLKECQPAKFSLRFTMTPDAPNMSVYTSEIMWKEGSECLVRTVYSEGTLINLVGSDMICGFTDKEIADGKPAANCKGPLYSIFKPKTN